MVKYLINKIEAYEEYRQQFGIDDSPPFIYEILALPFVILLGLLISCIVCSLTGN